MSTRGRRPEWDEDEWEDEPRDRSRSRRRPPRPPARTFGLPIVIGALAVGLLIGFIASCGGGGTSTVTEQVTVTAAAGAEQPSADVVPSGPGSRATITLAFLNGAGEVGLAGRRADGARALGYERVVAADAPALVDADQLWFRRGAAARAAQVAEDLGLESPTLAEAGNPVLDAAPDSAVIVVLGSAGASETTPSDEVTSTTSTTG